MAEVETPPVVEEPDTPAVEPEKPAEPQEQQKKAEADALRRASEAERRAKRLEDQAKKRDAEEAEKQGEYQKLYEQGKKELEQARSDAAKAAHEQQVARVAGRLKFVDPQDVVWRVPLTDGADESTVESQLSEIAERSPHLIAKEAPAKPEIGQVHSPSAPVPGQPGPDQRPSPPPGKAPLQSVEEADRLSIEEAAARMPEIDWLIEHQQ